MSSPNSVDFVRCMKCGEIMKCSRYDGAALVAHIHNNHPEIEIIDTATKSKRHFYTDPTATPTATPTRTTPNRLARPEIKRRHRSLEDCGPGECNFSENRPSEEEGKMANLKQPLLVKDMDLSRYSATSEILARYPEIKECEYAPHNPNAQVAYTRRYKLPSTPPPGSVSLLQQPFQHTLYRTSLEKWCPANGTIYCPQCASNKQPLIKTKAQRFTRNKCGACCLLSCWPFCFVPWLLPGQSQEYLYCANCKTFLGLYDRHRNCLKPNRVYMAAGNEDQQKKPEKEPAKINWNQIEQNKLLENESPPPSQSLPADSLKSARVSSIIINGKQLPPEAVARLAKYKRFGSWVGIDFDDLPDAANSTSRQVSPKENDEIAAPSAAKEN